MVRFACSAQSHFLAEPVYVEASALLNKRLTGIGRLVARLLEAMTRIATVRLVTHVPLEQARVLKLSTALRCGEEITVDTESLPAADQDVGRWVRQVLRGKRRRHDLSVSSRHTGLYTMLRPPDRHFRRELCLLYDFTPVTIPWAHTRDTRESFGAFFSESSAQCDHAVAISQSTRNDAHWLLNMPHENVVVGYPGPSLCVDRHASPLHTKRRNDVILVVSTLEPRKNTPFLLKWFFETPVLPPAMELWWVGPPGWLCDQYKLLRRSSGKRRLKFLGMIPDCRLCHAYRTAALTVYPSLYEGFGFPVLDSLLHDTPVLCSFNSSLQEFAGPGVFFFDGHDVASLDAACRKLQHERPEAIDPDPLRDRYSWDRMAQTVLGLCV